MLIKIGSQMLLGRPPLGGRELKGHNVPLDTSYTGRPPLGGRELKDICRLNYSPVNMVDLLLEVVN